MECKYFLLIMNRVSDGDVNVIKYLHSRAGKEFLRRSYMKQLKIKCWALE